MRSDLQESLSTEMPRCIDVPTAGKAMGLSRNSAYAAAQRGEIPTVRIGGRLIVPLELFRQMLQDRAKML